MCQRPLFIVALLATVSALAATAVGSSCRAIPGDDDWPSKDSWDALNDTVSGRLITTNPVAHVCHDPTYSESQCNTTIQQWGQLSYMTSQPAEFLATWFQNESCVTYTLRETPCLLGNYPAYVLDVRRVDDIVAGLDFVRRSNIRLVVKNTGHDFYGKSTGKGALSLWTRNLKSMRMIPNYQSAHYNGPAIQLGAGVTGGDAARYAWEQGHRIVVGSCGTIGLAGGYTQGGGHSFLSGVYGFGADNVLEWEIVLASGQHLVATPTQHEDLYWALSGGGGGTFAVVVSMTVRVFPEGQSAVAALSFDVASAGSVDNFWNATESFFLEAEILADRHGISIDYGISNDSLVILGLMAPGLDEKTLASLTQPMMSTLAGIGISRRAANFAIVASPSYYDLWASTTAPLDSRPFKTPVLGGRMVSRSNMAHNSSLVFASIRRIVEGGRFSVSGVAFNALGSSRLATPISSNAVQPSLVEAFMSLIFLAAWTEGESWDTAAQLQNQLIHSLLPDFEAVTPGAGVYKNEGNWAQADFQENFYGSTYERLQTIKSLYDPTGVFYGMTTVGSEAWAPDGQGRLCRIGN